jgi:hypothetical protein
MLEPIQVNDSYQLSITPVKPPLPGLLKAAGIGNLVIGPLLAIANLIIVGLSISELERQHAPDGLSVFLKINIGIFCVLGLLLVIGGIGLLCNQKWGRILSLITGVLCLFSAMVVTVMNSIMKSMLETGAIPLRQGQQYFYFKGTTGLPGLAPLYGIFLIVVLLLPATREWARGGRTSAAGPMPAGTAAPVAVATPSRPTHVLAILSLVCSLIPFALITQIIGLTLGIIALVKIKKSNGAMGGKGFAIAGITISSLILAFIGGILLLVFVKGGFK